MPIILTVLTFPSVGQEIEKVIFTSQQVDEPSTKQGRSKFIIEFIRQTNGQLTAFDIQENKKTKKLRNNVTIEQERVDKIAEWERQNKRTFTQRDLGLDITTLKTQTNNHKLNFDLPTDLTVNVDSFQFCQNYKMTKTMSTGGETLSVTLIYKDERKQEIIFDSNDIGEGSFNLKDYVLCYTLLVDKVPNEVPSYGFFSKTKFTDIVLHYQKIVECEGYYYKEFTDKNPTMTSKDRRMMVGWNFVEYMRQRRKNE